jgi:TP901 family phage tail tape measure protein
MSNPALDYAATMTNDISPVVEAIIASLQQMGDVAASTAAQMTAAFDTVGESATQTAETVASANAAMAESAGATTASTDALAANKQALDDTSDSTRSLGAQFAAFRMPLIVAGVALAGIGIGAAVVGTQYESSMSVVQALTGQTSAQMAQFNDQILADAPAWGVGPKALGDSLYYILSAGTPANQAMGELEVVAKASAASFVDAKDDANALTTSLNSYGKGAQDAWQYQDMLLTAVKDGKQQMSDLASSIGKAASMGSIAGVSFSQVAAAESMLTLTGVSARQASLDLYDLMKDLDLQTDTLAKRADKLGVSFDEQKFKTMDLSHQLQYLEEATGGDASKLQALINNAPAFQAATKLMTDNGADFAKILDDMKNSSGMTATAFAIHSQTMGAAFERLRASAEVALIHISQALEPIVQRIVAHVIPALNQFSGWAATHGPQLFAIISTIAAAFGVALVGAIGAAVVAFVALNAVAIGITAGISLLVVGIALLITHWQAITAAWNNSHTALGQVGNALRTVLGFLAPLGQTLHDQVLGVVQQVSTTLTTQLKPALENIVNGLRPWIPIIEATAVVLAGVLLGALRALLSLLGSVLTGAIQFAGGLYSVIAGVFTLIAGVIGNELHFLYDLITGNWKQLGTDALAIWTSIQNGVVGIVTGFVNILVGLWKMSIGAIFSALGGFVSGVIGFFQHLFDLLVGHSIIPDLVTSIVSLITGMIPRVLSLIASLIAGFVSTLSGGVGSILSAIGAIKDGILSFFAGAASWLVHAGEDMMNGLLQGVKNVPVVGGVVSVGQNVINGLKGALGIHSPSTVFAEIGNNMILGFAQGIQSAQQQAIAATTQVAASATESFLPAVGATNGECVWKHRDRCIGRSIHHDCIGPQPRAA